MWVYFDNNEALFIEGGRYSVRTTYTAMTTNYRKTFIQSVSV